MVETCQAGKRVGDAFETEREPDSWNVATSEPPDQTIVPSTASEAACRVVGRNDFEDCAGVVLEPASKGRVVDEVVIGNA